MEQGLRKNWKRYSKCFIIVILLAAGLVRSTFSEEISEGESLFRGRCGICHQLPDPGILKPGQWRMVLDNMQKRMKQAGMLPYTDEEYEKVYQFLKK